MLSSEELERMRKEIRTIDEQESESTLLDQHIEISKDVSDGARNRIPTRGYTLTEGMIRYAHEHTVSNMQAARLLHVDLRTLKKYSKMYIDKETGLDLWELHKVKGAEKRKNIPRKRKRQKGDFRHTLEDVLGGKKVKYDRTVVLRRLIMEGYFPEECQRCGYNERRVTDYCVPLTLGFKDGNKKNFHIDNIDLVCLNCYYHYYGDSSLHLKDFRSYQTYYSDFIRDKMVKLGDKKYSEEDIDDTDTWGTAVNDLGQLDMGEEMGWDKAHKKYQREYKKKKYREIKK